MLCHPALRSAAIGWEKNGAGKDVDAHGDHTMSTHEPLSPAVLAPARHPQTVRSAALHHAVRRDLLRLERVLDEPMTAVRRQAVIGHVGFLLDQLTAQHRLLDRSIWPTAVLRRPDLSDLAERVRNAHQDLRPAVVVVRNATLGWSRSAPPGYGVFRRAGAERPARARHRPGRRTAPARLRGPAAGGGGGRARVFAWRTRPGWPGGCSGCWTTSTPGRPSCCCSGRRPPRCGSCGTASAAATTAAVI